MFSSAEVFCLSILVLCGAIVFARGECEIKFPVDPDIRPSFYKYVGTHKIKIDTFGVNVLKLHEKQELEAHCDTEFDIPGLHKKSKEIYARCEKRYIYLTADSSHQKKNEEYYHYSLNIECPRTTWDLYESRTNFHWCPANITSFILARIEQQDSMPPYYKYLAGICYDIYNNSFNSVYYTLGPNQMGRYDYKPDILESMYWPEIKIQYIKETFGTNDISSIIAKWEQLFYRVALSEYTWSSMMQHIELDYAFNDKFSSLLEFLWWPNLRLYNWQRYLNALEKHIENDNKIYDVLAGVSGALRVPVKKNCETFYTMGEVVLDSKQRIPLYIWNYLQEATNSSNEMVIIGFNSPFHEAYAQDDVIFCKDRCQEIPWLKEVSTSFRYNIMGIVFCCNVEDVRSSGRLNSFPNIEIKPRPVEVTELPTTTHEVQSNEIDDETFDE